MARQEPVLPLTTADTTATATPTNASSATSIASQPGFLTTNNNNGTGNGNNNNTSSDVSKSQPPPAHEGGRFSLATMTREVDKNFADIPVCICSFVSGLCDSVVFSASSVFVSMQTGNTVFLALGTANLPTHVPFMWLRALCSIGSFLAGAFAFGQLRRVKPTCKLTLSINFLAQSLMILAAAALAQSGAVPALADLHVAEDMAIRGEIDLVVLAPIALLAFQFGGQIVSSRQLGFNEVPTNVLTSVYCDLMSDPLLFSPLGANPKRNRRACAVVLMFAGAVLGGWLGRVGGSSGMAVALWLGGGIKLVMAVCWALWKAKAPVPAPASAAGKIESGVVTVARGKQ